MIVLGIETSCDETGIGIVKDGEVLINRTHTQSIHSRFGGVVPEIASRKHIEKIRIIFKEAMDEINMEAGDIGAVSVTRGPGLLSSLLVGLSFARGLAYSLDIPLIGINHLEAHIYSPFICREDIEYPLLTLIVSGGHTQLVRVNGFRDYHVLGQTLDDACGEAFDKVAKLIGIGYPGGPEIEKWAGRGRDDSFKFPVPDPEGLDFSYSGLKTSVLYSYRKLNNQEKISSIPDISASFQKAAIDSLLLKVKRAMKRTGIKRISISGGVSANKLLRKRIEKISKDWFVPEPEYTVDNGAMIASVGSKYCKEKRYSNLDIEANPGLKLNG